MEKCRQPSVPLSLQEQHHQALHHRPLCLLRTFSWQVSLLTEVDYPLTAVDYWSLNTHVKAKTQARCLVCLTDIAGTWNTPKRSYRSQFTSSWLMLAWAHRRACPHSQSQPSPPPKMDRAFDLLSPLHARACVEGQADGTSKSGQRLLVSHCNGQTGSTWSERHVYSRSELCSHPKR